MLQPFEPDPALVYSLEPAEEGVFHEITAGAQNDLERASALSRQMVAMYGMSERVGLANCV